MYAFKRGGTWTFEYEFEHRRIRRGGFPTKTLATLAGDADRKQQREKRTERIYGVRDERRPRGVPSLATYIRDGYSKHHLPRLEASTQKTARSQLRRLEVHLGRYQMDTIGPPVMDGYVTARLAAGVSPGHVAEEINRLSRVVNHARARGVLTANPFRGWKRPRAHRRDFRIVTPAEERKLLRSAGAFADVVAVALDTGLRKGELRVLERAWVQGGELRVQQPKTKRVKVIPLTPRARSVCTAHKTSVHHPYVFAQPDGRPWSLPWFDRRWYDALEAAGLAGIRFHDLRHTFATRLAEAGVSVPVVGELMGHKPPYSTTLRYFHALPEAKRAAIKKLAPPSSPPRRRVG